MPRMAVVSTRVSVSVSSQRNSLPLWIQSPVKEPSTRIVVPTSAVLMNNDRISVFVATAPWTFERRPVEAHLGEGDTVTIDSGLRTGEQVVVKGGILLND